MAINLNKLFDETFYIERLGKKPRGKGKWLFRIKRKGDKINTVIIAGDYNSAKLTLINQIESSKDKGKTVEKIEVLPERGI